ncbi:hypothetical protein BCL90_3459 [Pedobacter alluvionis]|uniref:Nitrogen regulatory IIA protein n=1 Tax=Pedobacter alluvionis TaxID=475253 RepID=A0A497XYB3_9SPHI|nr:hypothetical protein BCL90_3459 [Pedobacter alluvionis]
MKNIRTIIKKRCANLNSDWQKLPPVKQRKWIICFFAAYLLLTLIVVLTVWYDAKTEAVNNTAVRGHISNPITDRELKDSLTKKNQDHERQ